MAKLPYTYTIVPPNDPPRSKFTAGSSELGMLLKHSNYADLTINQKRDGMFQAWNEGVCGTPIELSVRELKYQPKLKWQLRTKDDCMKMHLYFKKLGNQMTAAQYLYEYEHYDELTDEHPR